MALIATRMSVFRGRPPGLASGSAAAAAPIPRRSNRSKAPAIPLTASPMIVRPHPRSPSRFPAESVNNTTKARASSFWVRLIVSKKTTACTHREAHPHPAQACSVRWKRASSFPVQPIKFPVPRSGSSCLYLLFLSATSAPRSEFLAMKVAHIRLCHSRMLFVRAQEMVFDAHNRERSPFSRERGTHSS